MSERRRTETRRALEEEPPSLSRRTARQAESGRRATADRPARRGPQVPDRPATGRTGPVEVPGAEGTRRARRNAETGSFRRPVEAPRSILDDAPRPIEDTVLAEGGRRARRAGRAETPARGLRTGSVPVTRTATPTGPVPTGSVPTGQAAPASRAELRGRAGSGRRAEPAALPSPFDPAARPGVSTEPGPGTVPGRSTEYVLDPGPAGSGDRPAGSTEVVGAEAVGRPRGRGRARAAAPVADGVRPTGRRRHGATSPASVDVELSRPRTRERAGRKRVQRLRGLAALTLTVAAVGVAMTATGIMPWSDDVVTVRQDPTAMNPTPETDGRTRPPLTDPSPQLSATPSVEVTPSATAPGTPSVTAFPKKKRPTQTSAQPEAPATSSATSADPAPRGGVVLTGGSAGGWYAGASGVGVTDGKFAEWVGQPVSVAATWSDTSDEVQRTLPSLTSDYRNWDGALDLAVGGTVLGSGENYASAASGAYDDRWREAARILAENRKNAKGPTFVRPFHEMNGDWYKNWMVTRDNSADFKKAFARYAGILRAAMPTVYIAWSPNFGDTTGLPVDYWYPGDSVVDVVAPDYYDDGSSDARISVSAWNNESDDKDDNGNPFGPESWRQFAQAHGKPLAFPEWGLKPEGSGVDHPEWIKAVNAWMNRNANTATWRIGQDIPKAASGKVLYSVYFNVVHEGNSGFTIYGTGANPESAAVFAKLKWGNVPR